MKRSSELYEGLVEVTRKYLSEASVRAAVDTTLAKRRVRPEELTSQSLADVVAEAMVGLRLFCEPEKLGDLMFDLAEYCERVEHANDQ